MSRVSVGCFFSFIISLIMINSVQAIELVDNRDGTITDTETKTMWQKSDDGVERIWEEAVQYCESLELAGFSDWLLPKVNQLETLIDSGYSPTINPLFIVKPSYYWSSSSSRHSAKSAKYINFYYGNSYAYSKDNTYYAICARDSTAAKAIKRLETSFSYIQGDNSTPLLVSFSTEQQGGVKPFFFEWDFGDDNTSSLADPVHVYIQAGTYRVVLTLSDNQGEVVVTQQDITVPKSMQENANSLENPEVLVDAAKRDHKELADNNQTTTQSIFTQQTILPESNLSQTVQTDAHALGVADKAITNQFTTGEISANDTLDKGDVSVELINDKLITVRYQETLEQAQQEIGRTEALAEKVIIDNSEPVVSSFPASVPPATEGRSQLHIFASAALQPIENKSVGHGLLAYSFVNALNGDADWNKDGKVTAHELKGYLSIAIDNLSASQQKPVISLDGDDYSVCADKGSTFVFSVGVELAQTGVASQEFAARNAEAVRQAIEDKCMHTKTSILIGTRTTRAEILNALKTIHSMITAQDNLIFYFSGDSESVRGRLNLHTSDTVADMSSFTGLFYDDIVSYFQDMKIANVTILLETQSPHSIGQ